MVGVFNAVDFFHPIWNKYRTGDVDYTAIQFFDEWNYLQRNGYLTYLNFQIDDDGYFAFVYPVDSKIVIPPQNLDDSNYGKWIVNNTQL